MKIAKKIRQVTGSAIGVTLKQEDKEILKIDLGDYVEISKVSNSIREKKIENKKEVKQNDRNTNNKQ